MSDRPHARTLRGIFATITNEKAGERPAARVADDPKSSSCIVWLIFLSHAPEALEMLAPKSIGEKLSRACHAKLSSMKGRLITRKRRGEMYWKRNNLEAAAMKKNGHV